MDTETSRQRPGGPLRGLRVRVLTPIVLLAVIQAAALGAVVFFVGPGQGDSLPERSGLVLGRLWDRIRAEQAGVERLAPLLASDYQLAALLSRGDDDGLESTLARLESRLGLRALSVYGANGAARQARGLEPSADVTTALVGAALGGATQSATVAGGDGLRLLAAAPLKGPNGVIGALVIETSLGRDALDQVTGSGSLQLAVYHRGQLVTTTVREPTVQMALLETEVAPGEPDLLKGKLEPLKQEALAVPFADGDAFVTVGPAPGLASLFGQKQWSILLVVGLLTATLILSAILLNHHIARPLEGMVLAVRSIVQGNYRSRVSASAIREVNDLHDAVAELATRSVLDPLTNLPNRALFRDSLKHALERSKAHHTLAAVLFLDLDDFKVINDTLGHGAGDRLLITVTQRLQECLRDGDTAARLGGDEFTVLLEELPHVEDATAVAERILTQLRAPFDLEGYEVFVTASIGIAVSNFGNHTVDDLLRNADVALYEAKKNGKSNYAVYKPAMNHYAWERLNLETDLRRALDRGELVLHFQPVVDLSTGRVSEMEALVRWEHPQRGLVAPGEFIPLAEETGLIVPLGQWVLEEACRQAKPWESGLPGAPAPTVSVNLSARAFQQASLMKRISQTLSDTGLDPKRLKLELTESVMMRDADMALAMLRELKGIGVQLAIDDFGTGFSALSYLKRFPIDTLKIDRSFVKGLTQDDNEDLAIVAAVIAFAKTLRLSVTGEGIESVEQLNRLRALGCDLGQGFYFAHPLTTAAARRLLGVPGQSGARPAAELLRYGRLSPVPNRGVEEIWVKASPRGA